MFMFKGTPFVVAFRNLVLIPEFDMETFFKKLSNKWFELKPQSNSKEWTKLLVEIYNWKNSNKIEAEGVKL
jgi:hypothetical protein